MKKYIAFVLFLALVLTGCAAKAEVTVVGDFTFDLPEGYAIANKTDKNCAIVRDEDSVVIGGIELTALTYNDINGKNSENIILYLQNDFHMTNDIEYITSNWGNKHKIVEVSLKKHSVDGQEEQYLHYFFENASNIYHCWLDTDEVPLEVAEQFRAITGIE